jgi:DHA2 family multidrug resistance protein
MTGAFIRRAAAKDPSARSDIRPFIGVAGVLIAAITSELNDQVTSIALADVRGALGISYDPGTWIQSLYVSAEIIGMALSPWCFVTFTLRHWTLFAIALCGVSSILIPFSPNLETIYALRLLQGLAEGLIIPLLMITALRALQPETRLYGLAVYALSASFTTTLAATLAAFWTDLLENWRLVFFQAFPLCTLAGMLVWYGDPEEEPHYERFQMFNWRGALLLIAGFGAFSTLLYQGDRLDWFNSPVICVLALISAITVPLFLVNEWYHPLPFIKLQLLARRNVAYGCVALFTFLIISQVGSTVPLRILQHVQGYRPLQSNLITLEIAIPQVVLLPAVAFLLDFPQVDPRFVSFVGLLLMLISCIGLSDVDYTWVRDQFYVWQAFQAVGQPMVTMPLLQMVTNSIRGAHEAPFAAALANTSRAVSETVGVWLLQLITHWRGALHSDRIIDQIGQNRFQIIESNSVVSKLPPSLLVKEQAQAPGGGLHALSAAVQQQVTILSAADTFLILGALTVFLIVVLILLPVRTLPPRLQLLNE